MRITHDITTPSVGETAVALGFFDGVHLGHRAVIERTVQQAQAQQLAPCVFTFSPTGGIPASKSGLTLLQTQSHKEEILRQMGVQELRSPNFNDFCSLSPTQFVNDLLHGVMHARVLVTGQNYHFGKAAAAGVDELHRLAEPLGIQVITVPPVLLEGELISSSRIRRALCDGDPQLANRMLGIPFALEGTVEHGKRLGRTINSPTINQTVPDDFTVPMLGVYLSEVTTPQGVYYGVTNIGLRPTVDGSTLKCETYLIGFAGDMYGKSVTTALLHLLRPEQKFDSVEALAKQIQVDIQQAMQLAAKL